MMAWLALGACTALALLLVHSGLRLRRQRRALCAALDEFADNNFQAVPLALREGELREVADACDRLLPKVQTTIAMLEWAARHDPMTDLLNSTSFRITVQSMLAANPGEGALLAIGVNELKRVNDSLGHTGGDQLLCAVADRLRMVASAGEGDTDTPIGEPVVARLGGNEFAIFLPGPVLRSNIEKLIQRLQRVVGEAVHIGAQSLRVKVSIGVAKVGYVGGQYDALLAAADAAMAQARAEGVGTYKFYTPAMRRAADELLEKEIDLRRALERGEFCLYYQPQLNLKTGKIDAVEALIRWNHPTRGLVPPGDFIPFAESYGLIDDIGDWVMVEAVRTAARWHASGRPLRMSINVSPKQLYRVELIPMLRACLARFNLPAHLLEIEITEAAIMRSEEFSLARIEGLRRDGVSIALDDFGTGYSNLAQLMSLPMDRLKLDRSLLDHIDTDRRQQVVVASMVSMASELGFEVLAEGVETAAQFELIKATGCAYVQGYLVARPMPECQMLATLGADETFPLCSPDLGGFADVHVA
jgi:diguanylate cyclase (GGDEF)-like protein